MLADGLLGKIAYSSKILEDQAINEKIAKLLENKIYLKAVGKMFPEAVPRLKKMQGEEDYYRDELEQTIAMQSDDGPSAIFPPQDEVSIVSQPSYVLEELQKR